MGTMLSEMLVRAAGWMEGKVGERVWLLVPQIVSPSLITFCSGIFTHVNVKRPCSLRVSLLRPIWMLQRRHPLRYPVILMVKSPTNFCSKSSPQITKGGHLQGLTQFLLDMNKESPSLSKLLSE
jgi:hypothetical protein